MVTLTIQQVKSVLFKQISLLSAIWCPLTYPKQLSVGDSTLSKGICVTALISALPVFKWTQNEDWPTLTILTMCLYSREMIV